ncbi:M23 family metallopeptidase [Caldibacillus lycopersici]|uniref:M23 family metallopeptidase n=1 Tax=Perspicuibacillus lycopersici TaxID=1325689 RepID=A0AAE3IRU4_9BACI|nr:M23 family metallopeptidase [Perspicuibacillus lycopersici]MCU9613463.1 M23 family metallopeptidase [Perspicuibacillus lycopersici]
MNVQLKENLTKMTDKAAKIRLHSNGVIKKTIIATLVVSTISINTAFANTNNESKLQKIYHVYINDEYLGTVSNKELVEDLVTEKMNAVKEEYKDYDFSLTTDEIVFVPEQMFRESKNEDDQVLNEINNDLAIKVEAVALKIDGKVVTYLENQDKVEEVIDQLKLKYVSDKDLEKLQASADSEVEAPALENGESRLLDVHLSKNVTISMENVKPDQILKTDNVVKLLQKGTLEEKKYSVKEGDVLGSIAEDHGLKLKQLLELNPKIDEDTVLQIGDQLNVTAYEPYLDVVIEKEVFKEEKIDYTTKVVEDSSMFKGDSKVVQEGSEGQKAVTYIISQVNGQEVSKEVKEEKVLKDPVEKIVHKGTKVVPSRGTGSFIWPTNGGYISSTMGYRWGNFHKGIDIARPSNYTIKAADNGKVVSAGWDGDYGNKIVIDHGNGMRTVYAHLSSINVSVGQTVAQGSKIGVMGSTGDSTGTHLHFEVYVNGSLKNPLNYLN